MVVINMLLPHRDLTWSIPALYPNIQITCEQCRLMYTMDHRRNTLMFPS